MVDLDNGKKYFFDCEVFKRNWLFTYIDRERYRADDYDPEKDVIYIWDNRQKLLDFVRDHETDLFCGFNCKRYDTQILRAILKGIKAKSMSDFIINENKEGYEYERTHAKTWAHPDVKYSFDVYDCADRFNGLKTLEAFMGSSIVESSVDFNINRELTDAEKRETEFYCRHDVEQTIEVFDRKIDEYNAVYDLVTLYFPDNPNYISKTKSQLSAMILNCDADLANRRREALNSKHSSFNDGWDIKLVDTLRINKYKEVIDWYLDDKNHFDGAKTVMNIAGVPHTLAWGGIHGAPKESLYRKGLILHADVNSYYPSLMIRYGLLSRNSKDPILDKDGNVTGYINHEEIGIPLGENNEYTKIYRKRLALKKAGKKKEQIPYKTVLNSTYGICNDINSIAFDPRQARSICANGQLLLIDLIEHLENHCELIQSNTDGIILYVKDENNYPKVQEVIKEWEDRTGMTMGIDKISEVYQKDVNNYLFINNQSEVIDELLNDIRSIDSNVKLENYKIYFDKTLFRISSIISKYKEKKLNLKEEEFGLKIIPSIDRKGAYSKELSDLDNDLPIVNKAVVDYMIYKTPVEETINNATDLIDFQKVLKLTSSYEYIKHNNEIYTNKIYRIFSSKNKYDTPLYKVKVKDNKEYSEGLFEEDEKDESLSRCGNSPQHCFINNEKVIGVKADDKLDRSWYIELAKERLSQYGLLESKKKEKVKFEDTSFSLF